MFNKKRLAMMAVAASMVLPTNLAYFSVTTSVLANTTTTEDTKTPTEDTTAEYKELTAENIDSFLTDKTPTDKTTHKTLTAGKYKLSGDITISDNSYIDIDGGATR